MSRPDRWVVAYTRFVVARAPWVLAATLVAATLISLPVRNIVFNSDYSVFFPESDPQVQRYTEVLRAYTNNASVFFVVTAKEGDIFAPGTLEALLELTERAWDMPNVIRVDSVTNYPHARWQDEQLQVSPLVPPDEALTNELRVSAKEIAIADPVLRGRLINESATVTGVNARVGRGEIEQVEFAKALQAELESKYPNIEIRLTGLVALNNGFRDATIEDFLTLAPIMICVLLLTMTLLLRSAWLTIATFGVVLLSVFSALGLASLLGIEVSGPVAPAPTMIMTLGIADGVHILASMLWYLRHGRTKDDALVESMRLNLGPVFLTSITTSVGFLSMTIRAVPPLQAMAIVTASGVIFAFLYSITFLPAFVALVPVRASQKVRRFDGTTMMARLANWVIERRKRLFWVSIAVAATLASFIPRIDFNNQFVDFLRPWVTIRADTDYAAEHLTGIFQVTYSVPAEKPGGIYEPEYMNTLDAFRAWLMDQPGVVHVDSVSDTVKRVNQLRARGDDSAYRIPETRGEIEFLLNAYGAGLPKGLTLRTSVTEDASATRLIATTDNLPSHEIQRLRNDSRAWFATNAPDWMRSEAMGPWVMFADIAKTMQAGMLLSTPLALILVSLCLLIALRSWRFGLLSLIPNLLPLGAAFGVWGLLDWDMDFAMAGVMAMGIGIVVDDTVHFMSKYLRARRDYGMDPEDAVRYAFTSVGLALIITSSVLITGFMVLMFSLFYFSVNMGLLTGLVIAFALACDLFFLPALLIAVDRTDTPSRE